jgi:hypothetical protein
MNTKSNFAYSISIARNICRRMSGILKVFLLLSCAIAGASAAEPGRVTELMTKALVNVPGKEVTMIQWIILRALWTPSTVITRVLLSMCSKARS